MIEDTGATSILSDDPTQPGLAITQSLAGGGFQLVDGSQGAGKVLTTDPSGLASWQAYPTLPVGAIAMWSGTLASIPAGWALCDGAGPGVPDLRDRFVVGVGAGGLAEVGGVGGDHTPALTAAQVPPHAHPFTSDAGGAGHTHSLTSSASGSSHTHSMGTSSSTGLSHGHSLSLNSAGNHNHSLSTGSGGSSHTHNLSLIGVIPSGPVGHQPLSVSSGGGHTPRNVSTHTSGAHNHSGTTSNAWGGHAHPGSATGSASMAHTHTGATGSGSAGHSHSGASGNGSAGHTHTGTTASAGSGAAFDNRPVFYQIAFIIKL